MPKPMSESKLNSVPKSFYDAEVTRAQDHINKIAAANKNMADKLDEAEHKEKLMAWALDRALNYFQHANTDGHTPEQVMDVADKFYDYQRQSSVKAIAELTKMSEEGNA